ncbi:hypothetical protein FACS1894204_05440 [Synergistales bacterium]|nr:hypothetical protein FACS1894204_05440 [Synergistales bacterium]
MKIFAALPELLESSIVVGPEEVLHPEKHTDVKQFWRLSARANLDGKHVDVSFLVEEHTDGKIYYNHSLDDKNLSSGISGTSEKEALPPSANRSYKQSIADSSDNINIQNNYSGSRKGQIPEVGRYKKFLVFAAEVRFCYFIISVRTLRQAL